MTVNGVVLKGITELKIPLIPELESAGLKDNHLEELRPNIKPVACEVTWNFKTFSIFSHVSVIYCNKS